ncbi:nuclear transport factor 2 family protein [Pseudonocardia broussonetiae]|uniref:Nuclear transport factor 2 family protein n=1 Tax=Pseudonocardia broussonetiae TaxID=2736640 RepID=A0A6M6JJC1_9PSEU|nr:nuclear transport factor 2 family protein [Pseudonocardia broussonetiae]QJY47120.1 nuclear transport factor 2 family protein [Pseudonocardia broussonetiae]
MIIEEYYTRLDGSESLTALDLVEPDVSFLIALPGTEVTGTGHAALRDYIEGRPAVGRRHTVLRRSVDGDLEMVYGIITEGDGRGTGSFSSVALISADERVARYQAFFHPSFGMFPLPGGGR